MNDRELLQAAADAAGIKIHFGYTLIWDGEVRYFDDTVPHLNDFFDTVWNPLEDDGDAFRLAVVLKMTIPPVTHEELSAVPDKMASLRRAIVLMASKQTGVKK